MIWICNRLLNWAAVIDCWIESQLLKMLRLKRLTSLRPAITVNSRVFFTDEEDKLKLFSLIPSHHPSHLIFNRFFDFYQVFQSSLFLFCLDPKLIKEFKHKTCKCIRQTTLHDCPSWALTLHRRYSLLRSTKSVPFLKFTECLVLCLVLVVW